MADPIQVEGLRQLRSELAAVGEDLAVGLKQLQRDAADEVATLARQIVPYRSGDLAKTIRTGATARAATVKAGNRRVPYAGPIHFGWRRRHISPQPFLFDALDRRRDAALAVFEEGVAKLITAHHWRS